MEKIIQPVFYASWALWLLYSYILLLLKRNVAPAASEGGTGIPGGLGRHSVVGMLLSTIAVFSLFFLLTGDFKSDSIFFIENYHYKLTDGQKEVVIGNSVEGTDITLENPSADGRHLKLIFEDGHFEARDISDNKRVYLNGKYLDRTKLKEGDEIEIGGKETFKVLKFSPQYPLGRSITFSIKKKGQEKSQRITLHTLLDKSVTIRGAASLTYETRSRFLGADIYYIIVFFMIFLLCVGIYLYLKNGLNGALLLLMMASLPFGAGFIPARVQGIMILIFVPFIIYIERRRKTRWKWGSILVFLLYASVFLLPMLLRMEGDFTLGHIHSSRKNAPAIRVTGGNSEGAFELFDRREKLAYEETHEVILGHTLYRLRVDETAVVLSPVDPEKVNISGDYNAIISNLSEVTPGNNYVYLKFPHEFDRLPAESLAGKEEITVTGKKGNSVTLSKFVNEHYRFYLLGLIFMIAVPFWLFWFFYRSRFYRINFVVYNFVYFMLGLGYVIFGALALYNNSYFKNFSKFRDSALPLFVGLFLVFLLLSRYNRFLVFLFRVFRQKRYHIPFLVSMVLVLPVNYSPFFLIGGVLFFLFVFVFRLGRGIIYEYKNARSYPLDIKRVIETPVCSFEDKGNQRLFFGLGGILNRKGWNYLLIADLLLLLALFFIVLQLFLGGELGVSVGGFFFLPIELGKILLTLYFADWVSRIDKGMAFNVVWVYMLVLVPFGLLIFFLRDFSPLMVFAFVFFYHLVKIKKYVLLRFLLFGLGLWAIREVVVTMGNYSFPYRLFAVGFSLPILFILLRVWFKRRHGTHSGRGIIIAKKVLLTLVLVFILIVGNHAVLSRHLPVPRVLADRVNVWLNPWQDYNLSYQYVNSLWLMKGAGTYGKSADALTAAARVPLIEKDLSFTLYVSVMGMVGIGLLFLTLFLIAVVVIRRRGSRWHGYVLEFLTIIFFAQLLLPVLYVVGLLPLMGQPQPFLSYSNNLLLLFVLPFSFLMIILSQDSSPGIGTNGSNAADSPGRASKKFLPR
ncbi:MAG: FtsW/RodA/SpoVE family cell cycle protein, partial [bacterium]|nr:FtsW/RodA/SpoVE family cell cycle protein [bacterium]